MLVLVAAIAGTMLMAGVTAGTATAHSSGCHSSYSCPSDHHSYTWYDSAGTGWSCARPGSDKFNPSWDTTLITYAGLPYYCHLAGSSPPPPPVYEPPVYEEPEEELEPEPEVKETPLPVYVGTFGFTAFASPSQLKPGELHPFSGDDNAYFYGVRWRSWGKPKARGRGKAAVNNCKPSCAAGRFVRRRGAKAVLYRLRKGRCDGEAARFYTRASMRFPKRYGISGMTLKLKTRCD